MGARINILRDSNFYRSINRNIPCEPLDTRPLCSCSSEKLVIYRIKRINQSRSACIRVNFANEFGPIWGCVLIFHPLSGDHEFEASAHTPDSRKTRIYFIAHISRGCGRNFREVLNVLAQMNLRDSDNEQTTKHLWESCAKSQTSAQHAAELDKNTTRQGQTQRIPRTLKGDGKAIKG